MATSRWGTAYASGITWYSLSGRPIVRSTPITIPGLAARTPHRRRQPPISGPQVHRRPTKKPWATSRTRLRTRGHHGLYYRSADRSTRQAGDTDFPVYSPQRRRLLLAATSKRLRDGHSSTQIGREIKQCDASSASCRSPRERDLVDVVSAGGRREERLTAYGTPAGLAAWSSRFWSARDSGSVA